jgi:hypothetical protein
MWKGVRPWRPWHSVEDSQEFSVRNLNLEFLFEVSLKNSNKCTHSRTKD